MNSSSTSIYPAAEATQEGPPPAPDLAFVHCIERLESLIEAETRILKSCVHVDFDALNLRKTHALLEFIQVAKSASKESVAQAEARLGNLQTLAAANAEALKRHLQAVQEITALILDSIRKDEWDGTYSTKGAGRR